LFGCGGRGVTIHEHPKAIPYHHDIIKFSPRTQEHIFHECAPLYEKGMSLREIEEKTGIPKTTIRETLTSHGMVLRKAPDRQSSENKKPIKRRTPVIPYGYAWLEGQMIMEPKEYKIVLKILGLWEKGLSCRAIAKKLNEQNTPTRMGKKWNKTVIGSIIQRHLDDKNNK